MTDCIVTTLHSLLTTFPDAGIMGGGDRNCYNLTRLLDAVPRLQNIQLLPTLGGKNLDVILSTLGRYYSPPLIVPPVKCDDPTKGVPSDHSVPIIYPINSSTLSDPKCYTVKTTRPLPDSGVRAFGQQIIQEDWDNVSERDSVDTQ